MNSESDNPTEGLSEFFRAIWQETEGFVYLPSLNRETGKWKRTFFEWPKHEPLIIQHVLSASAQGLESYYCPALYKTHDNATKENVLGSNVLWTEFDGDAPEHWNSETRIVSEPVSGPATPSRDSGASEALEGASEAPVAAERHMPPPTVRVQSSKDGHEHVYWRLNEFVTDVQWIDDKNRAITYQYGADTSGWDATQILRPPYTTNYKRDLSVSVRELDSSSYSKGRFAFLRPPAELVKANINIEELPSVEKVISKYKWDDTNFELFTSEFPTDRSGGLMKIGYFGAEQGMSDSEIYALLMHADDRWKKYVNRQDRKARLTDIINRARQKHPKAVSEYTFAGLLGKSEKVEIGRPQIYGFNSFLNSDVKVEWAIEGLVEIGGMGMVAAMPGIGKTQWSLQLACAAALGVKFLKWDCLKPQKIVFFSLEMSHVALKFFIEAIAREYTDEQRELLEQNLLIVPLGEVLHLDRPEGMTFVNSLLDDINPDGIIIDSVGKTTMDELNEKVSRRLNVMFRELRNRYGCYLWFIHHNRKASDGNKKPIALGDVYGNMYLTSDMTSVIILYSDFKTDNEVEVIPVKARLSKMEKPFKTIRNENLHFSVSASTETVPTIIRKGDGNERKNEEGSNQRSHNASGNFDGFGDI